jgi:CDP-diglyceride synthetase
MKRFLRKLTAIVLTRLLLLIEIYVISIFSVSPVMCLFWVIKEAFHLEAFSGRFAFLAIWQLSCIVFTVLYSIRIEIKYRKMYSVEKK